MATVALSSCSKDQDLSGYVAKSDVNAISDGTSQIVVTVTGTTNIQDYNSAGQQISTTINPLTFTAQYGSRNTYGTVATYNKSTTNTTNFWIDNLSDKADFNATKENTISGNFSLKEGATKGTGYIYVNAFVTTTDGKEVRVSTSVYDVKDIAFDAATGIVSGTFIKEVDGLFISATFKLKATRTY